MKSARSTQTRYGVLLNPLHFPLEYSVGMYGVKYFI